MQPQASERRDPSLQLPPPQATPEQARIAAVSLLPLIEPDRSRRTLAWRGAHGVSQQQFLHDVRVLAARLPQASHALNLCEDRYRFMTAFAAVCLRGQTNLLPPGPAAGMIGEIAGAYPGCYALIDSAPPELALPLIAVQDTDGEASAQAVPVLRADHVAALVFTSGSTGAPQAHAKTWSSLVQIARYTAQHCLGDSDSGASIVATVPSQHMYGLETTVMMALAGGCAAHAGRAFFPADLREALWQVPAPRVLVTTPVHLRACLASAHPFPPLLRIICATAPLEPELAAAAEAALGAPVVEIYGCTEAGSMATRRTVRTPLWQFFPGMRLNRRNGMDFVHGRHLSAPVTLPDVVVDLGRGRFRLCGRSADMLKVAGKRASLHELTTRLQRIPGVRDAVVFVPEPFAGDAARPAALVVAPDLSESQILGALALTVDPVFLPRPLIRVPQLPRNAVGKLPRAALLAELERCND
jgi:acyl-coenzyme A synthetase/AMP-(fatty) acid ligase